jgi:Domain of unknown function (DUF4350)
MTTAPEENLFAGWRASLGLAGPARQAVPARGLWWAVPSAALALLLLLALLLGEAPESGTHGTSYDASPAGFRAAYLLLDELHYPVRRSRQAAPRPVGLPTGRQAVGGSVRWVLYPGPTRDRDVAALDAWVRRGGVVLLAVPDGAFAEHLGLHVTATSAPPAVLGATGPDVHSLAVGDRRVTAIDPGGRPWAGVTVAGEPLVTIYPHGQGEVWLLHRPAVLENQNLRRQDNAILACRLAEAMLDERPGEVAFDEYYHGLRERPGVTDLLLRPPMRAVTLQAVALGVLLLWHYAPRFGTLRPLPPARRRSKEEFLDAMASLLERQGDTAEAFRTVQQDLLRRLEADLGLPAGTPVQQTVGEAARRRGVDSRDLLPLLTADAPPGGRGPKAFLGALHRLQTISDELSQRRPHHR